MISNLLWSHSWEIQLELLFAVKVALWPRCCWPQQTEPDIGTYNHWFWIVIFMKYFWIVELLSALNRLKLFIITALVTWSPSAPCGRVIICCTDRTHMLVSHGLSLNWKTSLYLLHTNLCPMCPTSHLHSSMICITGIDLLDSSVVPSDLWVMETPGQGVGGGLWHTIWELPLLPRKPT